MIRAKTTSHETTSHWLRRQSKLLLALLDQAQRAVETGDRGHAVDAVRTLAGRLQQRIHLTEESLFPWIEQQVQQAPFPPISRLQEEQSVLREQLSHAIDVLLNERMATAAATLQRLRMLLEAHLDEEDRVVCPLVSAEAGSPTV